MNIKLEQNKTGLGDKDHEEQQTYNNWQNKWNTLNSTWGKQAA